MARAGRSNDGIDLDRFRDDQEGLFQLMDELGSDFGSEGEEEFDFLEEPPTERPDQIDNSSDSEEDLPLIHFQKLQWKHGDFRSKDFPVKENFTLSSVKTPNEYFAKYLDDDFFQSAASYTTQYFLQTNAKENNFTAQEIKKFFGKNALMGCIHLPRIHMYWNEKFKFSLIDGVMPRQRFYMIRVNLHVVDNLSVPEEEQKKNRLWKIQPVIDLVRNRCKAIDRKDEQMIPFLGRCPVRQFVKNKPRSVGLKNFVVTTSDGLIMDFEIYQGNTTPLKYRELGLGASVVLRLVETLPENSYLYFDRYFSTVALMDKLITLKIDATATIMSNRVKGFEFKKDNAMNRGESDMVVRTDGKLCITKWKDNKSVLMISTAFGRDPEIQVQRWNKTEKKRTGISCPAVVKSYNEHMGGVDVCDQMMEYYRSFFRTRKWTVKAILHLFVNSWMEYRRDCQSQKLRSKEVMDLLEFRLSLGEYLVAGTKKRVLEETEEAEISEDENINQGNERKKEEYLQIFPAWTNDLTVLNTGQTTKK